MSDSTKLVLIAADGARAEVYRHGAQVTSWTPATGAERLFLSERSSFDAGSAIRGGVPVIFPQFASTGPLPKHGFARTAEWDVTDVSASSARFRLSSGAATMAVWPYAFIAELGVRIDGGTLEIELSVRNTGMDSFSFTAALHTYLAVHDIGATTIRGLTGHHYRDSVNGGAERVDEADRVMVDGEIDRIYLDVGQSLTLDDGAHITEVGMRGFRDVVIWNPGVQKSASLADMPPDGYRRMVCVEAAAIKTPVVLAASGEWSGAQRLVAR